MKLSRQTLVELIKQELNEMSYDDFDMSDHVRQKRMDRQRRGEPDPRNLPPGDPSQSRYVQSDPDATRAVVVDLITQAGGDEALADSIIAAVEKMKEDGLI
tara:strand:+ start:125 stop:427 length:303 start_codon:yes stop_codon:yes gene_type:complete